MRAEPALRPPAGPHRLRPPGDRRWGGGSSTPRGLKDSVFSIVLMPDPRPGCGKLGFWFSWRVGACLKGNHSVHRGGLSGVRASGGSVGSAWATLILCFSWETGGFNKPLRCVVIRNPKIYLKVHISYPSTATSFGALMKSWYSCCSTPNLYRCQGNIEVENNKHRCVYQLSSDHWNCCCDTVSPLPHGCLWTILFL